MAEGITNLTELSSGHAPAAEGSLTPGTSPNALAIAKALRIVARKASRMGQRGRGLEAGRRRSIVSIISWISFFTVVVLPSSAAVVYFGFIASPQYVSEVAFAVRGPTATNDLLGGLGSIANPQRTQDALIVADYVHSRQLVEDLETDIGFRRRFTGASIDWVSRLKPWDRIEDVVRYWQWQVDTKIDKNSGVVTIRVRAFSPSDALEIAEALRLRSEALVNALSERARQDTVQRSQQELEQASDSLRLGLKSASQLRNEKGVLDAAKSAEVLSKVIGELRGHLLALEGNYAIQRGSLSSSSPTMTMLSAQITNLREQIATLEGRIASPNHRETLADAQADLDRSSLEVKLAEQRYALAVARFEQARLDAKSKQVYLMTFIAPRLAEDALYPKRWLMMGLVLAGALFVWGSIVGLSVLVRDHIAV
jgi:capsular polysaccharide transport system permease protein